MASQPRERPSPRRTSLAMTFRTADELRQYTSERFRHVSDHRGPASVRIFRPRPTWLTSRRHAAPERRLRPDHQAGFWPRLATGYPALTWTNAPTGASPPSFGSPRGREFMSRDIANRVSGHPSTSGVLLRLAVAAGIELQSPQQLAVLGEVLTSRSARSRSTRPPAWRLPRPMWWSGLL